MVIQPRTMALMEPWRRIEFREEEDVELKTPIDLQKVTKRSSIEARMLEKLVVLQDLEGRDNSRYSPNQVPVLGSYI